MGMWVRGGCQCGRKETAPVRGSDLCRPLPPAAHTAHGPHSLPHARQSYRKIPGADQEERQSSRTFFSFDNLALDTRVSCLGFSDVLCAGPTGGHVRGQVPTQRARGGLRAWLSNKLPGQMDSLPGLCCEQRGAGHVTRKFSAPGYLLSFNHVPSAVMFAVY